MEQLNTRNKTFDILKGIGIILITFYHLVYRLENGTIDEFIKNFIWLILPIFFLISGYFYKVGKYSIKENILRRTKNLLIPTIIYLLILFLIGTIQFVLLHNYNLMDLLKDFLNIFIRPELADPIFKEIGGDLFFNLSPSWYIWTCFLSSILFFIIANISLKNKKNMIISTIILLSLGTIAHIFIPPTPWSIALTPFYASIMLLGAYISNNDLLSKLNFKLPITIIIILIGFIINGILYYFFGTDLLYISVLSSNKYMGPLMCYIQVIPGGISLYLLCNLLSKFKFSNIFSWCGKYSLEFLLCHSLYGGIGADILNTNMKPGQYWYVDINTEIVLKSIGTFIISIILCVFTILLVNFIKKYQKNRKKA